MDDKYYYLWQNVQITLEEYLKKAYNKNMEKIDKAIEILTAFKEGKTIEHQIINKSDVLCGHWIKTTSLYDILSYLRGEVPVRIAKQPTYRPYSSAEEFLKASKKHGPYLLTTGHYFHMPTLIQDDCVYISCNDNYNWMQLYNIFKWQDSTPCGILEQ